MKAARVAGQPSERVKYRVRNGRAIVPKRLTKAAAESTQTRRGRRRSESQACMAERPAGLADRGRDLDVPALVGVSEELHVLLSAAHEVLDLGARPGAAHLRPGLEDRLLGQVADGEGQ